MIDSQGLQYVKLSRWKWKWSRSVVSNSLQPVDSSPPSSSVHGILQARILEWVAISFSRGSPRPRDRTQVSHIAGRRFNLCATREALKYKNQRFQGRKGSQVERRSGRKQEREAKGVALSLWMATNLPFPVGYNPATVLHTPSYLYVTVVCLGLVFLYAKMPSPRRRDLCPGQSPRRMLSRDHCRAWQWRGDHSPWRLASEVTDGLLSSADLNWWQ